MINQSKRLWLGKSSDVRIHCKSFVLSDLKGEKSHCKIPVLSKFRFETSF